MFINHIDIPVPDVAATRDFFVNALGFEHIETRGRDGLAILADSRRTILVLSKSKQGSAPRDGFHIGFLLDSKEAVDATHDRLSKLQIEIGAPRAMRGAWLFYCEAPGPVTIEVAHRP